MAQEMVCQFDEKPQEMPAIFPGIWLCQQTRYAAQTLSGGEIRRTEYRSKGGMQVTSQEAFIDSFRSPKSHNNAILDLYPFSKLNFAAVMLFGGALLGSYWSRLAVIALCFLINAWAGGETLRRFCRLYIPIAALLFSFLLVLNAAFQPGETVYWSWWIIDITREGFLKGLAMGLLITEICGAIMTFYMITPLKDLSYAIEGLGISRSASYILLASMQSVTDLGKTAHVIMESQSARGVETTGSLRIRFKALIPILFPLLLGSIAATEEKAVAMETRAFASRARATHIYELRRVPLWEKAACVAADAAVIAAIIWRFLG